MLVTVAEAKEYLRVDRDSEDAAIADMVAAAQSLCLDVARLDETTAQAHLPILREAILYATAFQYEHRDEADYAGLLQMLRALLSQVREAAF